jgi:putative ABC transport system substrate-binding protein
MMDRRAFIVTLASGFLAAPFAAETQQARKVWRIGFLGGSQSNVAFSEAFEQGLRELGYVNGQNIAIEYRFAEGKDERLPLLAAELVGLKVDVLVAPITQGTLAAKHATKTIPIVMVNVAGPVESGFVSSLARPGGNITGLSRLTPELIGKNLELLKEAVPQADRVAALANPTNPLYPVMVRNAEHAAGSLGVELRVVEARAPNELDGAFASMARERANALLVLPDGMFWSQRRRIADLALKNHLPSTFQNSEHAEAGGLMSYAPNSIAPYRRAAVYVDKILKGAKPADLPVEQPTKLELTINLKTAKALGLTIPQSLLERADQVIE